MRSFLTACVGNTVLANVLLLTIVLVGTLAALNMVREGLPDVSTDNIEISVAYPGADPAETEEAISRRIEAAVDGLEGVKHYHTASFEGGAEATIEVADGYDVQEVRDRVRNAVDAITTFPDEAEAPRISIETLGEGIFETDPRI